MRVSIIIQARSTSKRFPNKMMAQINGKPLIQHVYDRCCGALGYKSRIFNTHIAFTIPDHDPLNDWLDSNDIDYTTGPEDDLISRYDLAIRKFLPETIIRITGDCAAIPSNMITSAIETLVSVDYVSNSVVRTYYDGFDVQGCSIRAWNKFFLNQKSYREHPFREFDMNESVRDDFQKSGFTWTQIVDNQNKNQIKLSVDEPKDIKTIETFLDKEKA